MVETVFPVCSERLIQVIKDCSISRRDLDSETTVCAGSTEGRCNALPLQVPFTVADTVFRFLGQATHFQSTMWQRARQTGSLLCYTDRVVQTRRKAVAPSLHRKYLSTMVDTVFSSCTDQLISKLEGVAASGKAINMEAAFSQLTLDIIGKSVFNYDFDALTSDSPVIQAVYTALKETESRSTDILPYWQVGHRAASLYLFEVLVGCVCRVMLNSLKLYESLFHGLLHLNTEAPQVGTFERRALRRLKKGIVNWQERFNAQFWMSGSAFSGSADRTKALCVSNSPLIDVRQRKAILCYPSILMPAVMASFPDSTHLFHSRASWTLDRRTFRLAQTCFLIPRCCKHKSSIFFPEKSKVSMNLTSNLLLRAGSADVRARSRATESRSCLEAISETAATHHFLRILQHHNF